MESKSSNHLTPVTELYTCHIPQDFRTAQEPATYPFARKELAIAEMRKAREFTVGFFTANAPDEARESSPTLSLAAQSPGEVPS